MKKQHLILSIVIAIVLCGISYYAGTQMGNSTSANNGKNGFSRNGNVQGGARGGMNGANFVNGEILSKDDKSITIKLRDGGSKVIYLSDKTRINKITDGTVNDLAIGTQVSANGATDASGILTADMVQIRPAITNNNTNG